MEEEVRKVQKVQGHIFNCQYLGKWGRDVIFKKLALISSVKPSAS